MQECRFVSGQRAAGNRSSPVRLRRKKRRMPAARASSALDSQARKSSAPHANAALGWRMRSCAVLLISLLLVPSAARAQKPRERDLNLPIGGTAGPLDAITDVAGVEVGQTTLVSGSGKLIVGQGPVR